ncbi:MAG: hypothetical protein D6729_05760, partial [Deltaproteobacteria bacterium]
PRLRPVLPPKQVPKVRRWTGLAVADLDGDRATEVAALAEVAGRLFVLDGQGKVRAEEELLRNSHWVGLAAGRLYEGEPPVLVAARNRRRSVVVWAFDGQALSYRAGIGLPEDGPPLLAVATGDLDRDGVDEIAVASTQRIEIFRARAGSRHLKRMVAWPLPEPVDDGAVGAAYLDVVQGTLLWRSPAGRLYQRPYAGTPGWLPVMDEGPPVSWAVRDGPDLWMMRRRDPVLLHRSL